MSFPEVDEIRKRIQKTRPDEAKYCLMATYLFCARISEIISITVPSDVGHTIARKIKGNDVNIETYEFGPIKEMAAVFSVQTAKRNGKIRKIALPLNPQYEPLTGELVDYFSLFGKNPVFNLSRRKAVRYAKKAFGNLKYPIENYVIYKNKQIIKSIPYHLKPFRCHALRHLRTNELLGLYEFDGFDLSVYGGWTLRNTAGIGSAISRYAHLNWRRYFPKLLKKR